MLPRGSVFSLSCSHYLFFLLQQWVDLARYTGLQRSEEKPPAEATMPPDSAHLEGCTTEGHDFDDSSNNTNKSTGPS